MSLGTSTDSLRELRAYERRRATLGPDDLGRIAVVHGDELLGVFPTVAEAHAEARRRFGSDPVLLKQVGAPEDCIHYGSLPESPEAIRLPTAASRLKEPFEVYFCRELAAYQRRRVDLEREHPGKVALLYGDQLVGVYGDLNQAAAAGTRLFGLERHLLQKIGDPPWELPLREPPEIVTA